MKKLLVVLSILFIGILLAGCTTQPPATVVTPTPTPTPVPTTVITTIPTEVPTTIVVVNTTATPNSTPTPTPTPQPSANITFTRDLTIKPGTTVVIPVGGKVIFVNDDPFKPHGVIAVDVSGGKYFGGMSPVTIPYGKPLEVTFDTAGTYDFQTVFQPSVVGKIIVTK